MTLQISKSNSRPNMRGGGFRYLQGRCTRQDIWLNEKITLFRLSSLSSITAGRPGITSATFVGVGQNGIYIPSATSGELLGDASTLPLPVEYCHSIERETLIDGLIITRGGKLPTC